MFTDDEFLGSAGPRAMDAFWGMLATREDRRGERIGLLLGAQAIIHMWERHGARGFMTGVRADNLSSQALCKKVGVTASDWIYASCIDKEVFGGASITKWHLDDRFQCSRTSE